MVETEVRRTAPQVGDRAPDFDLFDTRWKRHTLESFQGKTLVLAFFPAAFSGTCTNELCTLRQNLSSLNDCSAQVVGISVDLPYTLKQFKLVEQLSFPLLSDFDRQAIAAYGVVDGDFNGYRAGVAQRSVFIVDPEGTITWRWIARKQSEEPEYAELIAAAEKLGCS